MPTTTAHQMILRNTCGETRFFGYLGLHGAEFPDGDDIAVTGNIWDMHYRNQMLIDAFTNDLNNGDITILKSTGVFCWDETAHDVKVLGVDNGDPVAVDPDYGSYAGDDPGSYA